MYMKIKKSLLFFIVFLGAAIATVFYGLRYPQFFFGKRGQAPLVVSFPAQRVRVPVEVARDPFTWSRGLMFRESLPQGNGMLFVFPDERPRSFWMKHTLIPLDMIFIAKDKKIVAIQKNAMPCTTAICSTYDSTAGVMYVLEVNAGFTDRYGIREGHAVAFEI